MSTSGYIDLTGYDTEEDPVFVEQAMVCTDLDGNDTEEDTDQSAELEASVRPMEKKYSSGEVRNVLENTDGVEVEEITAGVLMCRVSVKAALDQATSWVEQWDETLCKSYTHRRDICES